MVIESFVRSFHTSKGLKKNDRPPTFRDNSIVSAILSILDTVGANKNGNFQNDSENSLLVTSSGQSVHFLKKI